VIWFVVVLYLLLSPVVCLVIGRGVRMRDAERPVEQCAAETDATPAPAEAPATEQMAVQAEVPVAV
jgi:hypothetical protein